MKAVKKDYAHVHEKLTAAGLRPTRQRILLGYLLFTGECRHVTAEMLYEEASREDIRVSLATVYNTLHQFTTAGLLHEITVDSGKSYFDTNCEPHHHFLHEKDNRLEDIHSDYVGLSALPLPPSGTAISSVQVVIRLKEATI